MCDCIKTMSETILSHVKVDIENEPGFQKIEDSYFKNRVYTLSDNGLNTSPILLPFKVEYTRKAKRPGNVRTYKKEISILTSFCPFCGHEYGKDE